MDEICQSAGKFDAERIRAETGENIRRLNRLAARTFAEFAELIEGKD